MNSTAEGSAVLRMAVEYFPIRSNVIRCKKNVFNHELLQTGPVGDVIKNKRVKDFRDELEFTKNVTKDVECKGRKFFVIRHAERLDRIFPEWMKRAWANKDDRYRAYDLNMPVTLPYRNDVGDYSNDSPLTEVGYSSSQLVGRAIRISCQTVSQIYCSPALRCVQTAQCLIKTCRKDYSCKINVEPGLFEFLGCYKDTPRFMSNEEYLKNGYEINVDYQPLVTVQDLQKLKPNKESIFAYYQRSHNVIEHILQRETNEWSTFLVVAHASSLDACTRRLLGRRTSLPTKSDMSIMGQVFPYLSVVSVRENVEEKCWKMADRVLANLCYYKNDNRIRGNFLNRP